VVDRLEAVLARPLPLNVDTADPDPMGIEASSANAGSNVGICLAIKLTTFAAIKATLGVGYARQLLDSIRSAADHAMTHGAWVTPLDSDTFVCWIPGEASSDLARLAALAVKSRIETVNYHSALTGGIHVAIGIAEGELGSSEASTRAESAARAALSSASGIVEWQPDFDTEVSHATELFPVLRQVLREHRLRTSYQPIIDIRSGLVTAVEALARLPLPGGEALSAWQFVSLAEAGGLAHAVTSQVLKSGLAEWKTWPEIAGNRLRLAINLSESDMRDEALMGIIAALLTAAGMSGHPLVIEIPQSALVEHSVGSAGVLFALKSLGAELAVNAFEPSYELLQYLQLAPVSEIKLRPELVGGIQVDVAARAVIRSVVEVAQHCDVRVVAVGLDSEEATNVAAELGVQFGQGHWIAPPMSAEQLLAWLWEHGSVRV
jgi:EAL domain-containing protein (putative c-di-GMP-specific phosphodiesterase class I)